MKHLTKVCSGAFFGASVLYLFVPESSLDTTFGPGFVAACAWAAEPLSTPQGRARAVASLASFASQLRAAQPFGNDWTAKSAAAALASQQLGLGGGTTVNPSFAPAPFSSGSTSGGPTSTSRPVIAVQVESGIGKQFGDLV